MEEDYGLKLGDFFVPFHGMIKYGDRVYGKSTMNNGKMNGMIKHQTKADIRQIVLFCYGVAAFTAVIAGLNAGLEKLLN